MGEKDKYSHFDMRAFRGHFRIASDHFEGMCKQFETLESLYKKAQSDNEKLTAERDALRREVEAANQLFAKAREIEGKGWLISNNSNPTGLIALRQYDSDDNLLSYTHHNTVIEAFTALEGESR